MWWSILVQLMIYIGIVMLIHYLYLYIKTTFTTPQRIHVHHLHEKAYQEIMEHVAHKPETEPVVQHALDRSLTEEQKQYLKQSLMHAMQNNIETL